MPYVPKSKRGKEGKALLNAIDVFLVKYEHAVDDLLTLLDAAGMQNISCNKLSIKIHRRLHGQNPCGPGRKKRYPKMRGYE